MVWEIVGDLLRIMVLAGLGIAGVIAILLWKKNLATRVTYLRLIIQAVSFAVIFYIFSYQISLLYVLIIILTMTIVLGRFYCGWICPFGLYMDLLTLLRRALKIRYRILSDKLNRSLHYLRYILIVFFIIMPFIFWEPIPNLDFAIPFALFFGGSFRHLSILLGPMVPLIVPWKGQLIISNLNFSYPYLQEVFRYAGENFALIASLIFMGLTLSGSFLIRRVWCRFCPTGSSLAIVNRFKGFKWAPLVHLDKDEEKCTKCGICKRVCPLQVTDVYDQKGGKINTSMCMLCLRCVEMCPYKNTLKVKFADKTLFKSRNWLEPSTTE